MIKLDRANGIVEVDGGQILLTPTEAYIVLELTRNNYTSQVWAGHYIIDSYLFRWHIAKIRKKVGKNFIHNRRGWGYYLDNAVEIV